LISSKYAEPSTRNLALTLVEMKRHQREMAKVQTHLLANKLSNYFQEENVNKTITQSELVELYLQGSLD
jgi:ABC-type enterochelin transport system ATPase subunit